MPIDKRTTFDASPPTVNGNLFFANVVILLLTAVLVVVWLAVPRDPFGGVVSYLPFHVYEETFTIAVAFMIFGVMWSNYNPDWGAGFVILACAMLAVALINVGHMVSAAGMPEFVTPASADKGILFWLARRLILAISLLTAALLERPGLRTLRTRSVMLSFFLALTGLVYWVVLSHNDAFPILLIAGKGLTAAKIAAECFITAVFALAAMVYYRRARRSCSILDFGLYATASIWGLGEVYFAIYMVDHDPFHILGHGYVLIGNLFMYCAVFIEAVREPMRKLAAEVDARRRAEDEIRRLNAGLERRVRERTRELEAANKELEGFSYSVAHDLRTPLRSIEGFSHIVMDEYAPQLPAEARHHLSRVCDATLQMGQLIDDLLALARLDRRAMRKETMFPLDVVRQALKELSADQRPDVQITMGVLPPCYADRILLKEVWVHLISNALKFTQTRHPASVEIGSHGRNGQTVYYVKDNGVGFDMKYAGKLFQTFQRLHRAEDYKGSGVGLSSVKRIIERHGGRVWAEGKVNEGATFYFTLEGEEFDEDQVRNVPARERFAT